MTNELLSEKQRVEKLCEICSDYSVDDFDELQTISPGFTFLMGKVVNALEESGKKDLANEVVETICVGHFLVDR